MKLYDPQMHSAEHILNQTMIRIFNTNRCVSMHLEKKKSKCDFVFNRSLTSTDEQAIETEVNRIINLNLDVTDKLMTRAEAQKLVNLDKLPNTEQEEVRIVQIGQYDACACIGSHVKNTSQIGEFKIISTSFEEGILRIRFKLNRPIQQSQTL